jgi:hypothetical protein
MDLGLNSDQVDAYLELRKAKKAPVSKRVIQLVINEVERHNKIKSKKMTIPDAFDMIISRSWLGFNADWVVDAPIPKNETLWQKMDRLGISDDDEKITDNNDLLLLAMSQSARKEF